MGKLKFLFVVLFFAIAFQACEGFKVFTKTERPLIEGVIEKLAKKHLNIDLSKVDSTLYFQSYKKKGTDFIYSYEQIKSMIEDSSGNYNIQGYYYNLNFKFVKSLSNEGDYILKGRIEKKRPLRE